MPQTETITMLNISQNDIMNTILLKKTIFIVWALIYNICVLVVCFLFRNEFMDNAILYSYEIYPPDYTVLSNEYYLFFNIVKFGGLAFNFVILLFIESRVKNLKKEMHATKIMLPLSILIFLVFWNRIIVCILEGWLLFLFCFIRMRMYSRSAL